MPWMWAVHARCLVAERGEREPRVEATETPQRGSEQDDGSARPLGMLQDGRAGSSLRPESGGEGDRGPLGWGGRQMDGAAPERGWEAFMCHKGGGRPLGAGHGEHKAEGLETTLDVDQRRLDNSATRLRPGSRVSTLLRPLIRGPPPACSLLPGSAYKGPGSLGCPLGPGASMPLPAPGPWPLEVVGGWGPGHSQTAPYALLFSGAWRQAKGSRVMPARNTAFPTPVLNP